MAVVPKQRVNGTTYYVTFEWNDKKVWERSGTDRRKAESLNAKRQKEVRDGTYRPNDKTRRPTVAQYGEEWLARRTCRWAKPEASLLRRFVLTREWFAGLHLDEVKPRHTIDVVRELKVTSSQKTGRQLGEKTVSIVYSILHTMFRDAVIEELCVANPCVLPKGMLRRTSHKKRAPYDVVDVCKVLSCGTVPPTARVFAAIAFLTGMRQGEVCGRRWRDWDRGPKPLGCLRVDSQYDGQPLKSDDSEAGEHTRWVPVHPDLEAVLDWWHREGWELVHLRKPTPDDWIVPSDRKLVYSRRGSYDMWRRALDEAGVENRSLHSTRHTFISLARRGGARQDVLEKVTHNAAGTIVDGYTHWDWAPLCEAVLCVRLAGDVDGDVCDSGSLLQAISPWSATAPSKRNNTKALSDGAADEPPKTPVKTPEGRRRAAHCAARHQTKLRGRPTAKDLIRKATRSALRGDEPTTLATMSRVARMLGGAS